MLPDRFFDMQLSVPTETLNKQCLLLTFKRNIMYILSYKLPQFMAGGGGLYSKGLRLQCWW